MRLRLLFFAASTSLALAASGATPIAADAAREARIADQVVPQIVVGEPVWLATPTRPRVLAIYTEPAGRARGAVVIVHGLGLHPDWGLNGELRSDLAQHELATLSVQMPVLAVDAPREAYRALFPDAASRLASAIAWLRARGYTRIAIVSHSLGAAMTNAFLAERGAAGVDAWVPIGFGEDFALPPAMPVLDIIAERDFPEVIAHARTRTAALPQDGCSSPLAISGADHYFEREGKALDAAVAPFLEKAFAGRCRP